MNRDNPARVPAEQAFAEQSVELLRRCVFENGREFDAAMARDAVARSGRLHPEPSASDWPRRLDEAAGDFGLRVSRVELSARQALRQARRGTRLIGWSSAIGLFRLSVGGWWSAALEPMSPAIGSHRVNRSQLAALLESNSEAPAVWAVCTPALPCQPDFHEDRHGHGSDGHGHDGHGHGPAHRPPWRRLLGLLRPDLPLIRSLVVFSIVAGVFTLAVPLTVDALVSAVAFGGLMQPVVVLAAVLMGAGLLSGVVRAAQAYLAEVIQRRLFVRMAVDLGHRLPRVRIEEHDRNYGPELVNRFFDVTTVQKSSALILLEGVNVVLAGVIGMVVLAFYHPLLLTFDLVLMAATTLIVFGPARKAVRTAVAESRMKYEVAGWLEEIARHPVAFMTPGGRGLAADRLDHLAREWLTARENHFRIVLRQVCGGLGLQAIAATALLALGGLLVIEGRLTLGQLVAAELIVSTVVGSIAKLGKHLESWYDMLAAVDKLGHLADLPVESRRGDAPVRADAPGGASLRAEHLEYGYRHGRPVINDLAFDIPGGSRAALLGPAGAGASTLLQILFGLRSPSHGRLTIDGYDLHEWHPDALRSQAALAGSVEIIDGTVIENVRFGRDDISIADVRDALITAGLWDSVRALPQGMYTRLTPSGEPLSGSRAGQLMIARAVAGRPRLLLLDGILDAMDRRRRDDVAQRLFDPERPWTLVIKTRMEDLVRRCDRTIDLAPRIATTSTEVHS